MQPHEGPRRDVRAEEREKRRQQLLTWQLSTAIIVLVAGIVGVWWWN